ncbi:hypothetical protein JCM11641_002791 [Rhodosporidiobolus odoratus]
MTVCKQLSRERHLILLRTPTEPPDQDPYTLASTPHFTSISHLPVLETTWSNLHHLTTLLHSTLTTDYDGVIITSARAVHAWGQAAASLSSSSFPSTHRPHQRPLPPFFVVGPGTRSALLDLPDSPYRPRKDEIFGAEESGTGQALAQFIRAYYDERERKVDPVSAGQRMNKKSEVRSEEAATGRQTRRRKRLLYLTGDKNRDTLPSILSSSSSASSHSTFDLDALQVYSTTVSPTFHSSLTSKLSSLSHSPYPLFSDPPSSSNDETSTPTGRAKPHPGPTLPQSTPPPKIEIWFALFSPSTAQPLLQSLRQLALFPPCTPPPPPPPHSSPQCSSPDTRLRLRFVAIGPTTRDYLLSAHHQTEEGGRGRGGQGGGGVRVDAMARKPDAKGLVEAMLEVFKAEEGERDGKGRGRGGERGGEGRGKERV